MSAEQTRLAAARWLERRQREDWSAEDQAALDSWLAEPRNMVAYLRAESVWDCTARLTVLRQPAQQPMRPQPRPDNSVWPILRRVAAVLAVAAMIGTVAYRQLSTPMEDIYATAIGEQKTVAFKDGTRVALNTDTVLRVSRNGGERKLWLDKGEAYFEVEHDAARPFIVIADGRKVTDLGTKFVVRQDAEKLRVAVVEGLVEVEAKGRKPQSLLRPGDVLTVTAKAQSVIQKPLTKIIAGLGWQHGKLFLDYATLAEAAEEFNRYNSQKLLIADPKAAQMTIVGTFQTRDLAVFTKAMKDIFGLKAENKNDQIILSR